MNVKIVQLGPLHEQLNLKGVVNKANRSQGQYIFHLADPLEYLPEPTEDEGHQYKFDLLADLLQSKRGNDTAQVLIGVIDHAIHDQMFSALNSELTCILISTADIEEGNVTQKTSMAGYVLFEIGAQLLTIEYRHLRKIKSEPEECAEPWHKKRLTCVFDWDEERKYTGQKIASPKICEVCRGLLYKAGVGPTVIDATTSLVRAGLTPIQKFLTNQTRAPIIILILGALLGNVSGLKVFSTVSWWLKPYTSLSLALVILLLYGFWRFSRNK